MGVFKNDVGRPSNKTIMIRNIFKVIGVLLIIVGVFIAGYYFKGNKNNKTKDKNKPVIVKNTKKEIVNIDEAKKELDRFVYGNYFNIVETQMNDDYKGYLAISKSKSKKKNYTCKEMFGNDIKSFGDDDGHSWDVVGVHGVCYDGEAIDFYEYETVNKEYEKLFGNNLPKKTIKPDIMTIYAYSELKNGFTQLSCECSDITLSEANKIYEAYKKNNELHIIFSLIPFLPKNEGNGIEAVFGSEKLSYSITNDIEYDEVNNKIKNSNELFEKYKDELPKYEFVLIKKEGSYIYKSFNEIK